MGATAATACLALAMVLAVGLYRDRRRIATLATTDGLTGLANRRKLDRVADELLRARGIDPPADLGPTVLVIDVDRSREINEGLGRRLGDELLCVAADRIRHGVTEGETVARIGSDEFVVLLPSGAASAGECAAQRIRTLLRAPLSIDGVEVTFDVSIGIATSDGDRLSTPYALIGAADLAMYAAKEQGAGHVTYTPDLGNEVAERARIGEQIRLAVDHDELVVHYQPQVALDSGELVAVEALLRWRHPERGLIAPGEFLPAVEDHAIMDRITTIVLRKAICQIAMWQAQGRSIPISVNVASRSLMNIGFPAEVAALLSEYAVDPHLLCVELTETTVMRDPARCGHTLRMLHDLGVRLSIDDYGTGYASIAHLKNLPIDELKIDRSFVSQILDDTQYRVLTESVIELGHNLGLTVVAEGIEDSDVAHALRALGCDLAQGYLYGRAVAPEEILGWRAVDTSPPAQTALPAPRRSADSLTLHFGQLRYQDS